MTTHIALEEGKDIEEVAQWGANRKIFHAQMLGAYHERRNEQMERGQQGYEQAAAADVDPSAYDFDTDLDGYTPTQSQSQSQSGSGLDPGDPANRRQNTFRIANEDVDWQFCEQCRGMFEPGEYEEHFEMNRFDCVA